MNAFYGEYIACLDTQQYSGIIRTSDGEDKNVVIFSLYFCSRLLVLPPFSDDSTWLFFRRWSRLYAKADNESMYNTPPCWTMYTSGLVFKKLLKMGGLEAVAKLNEEKAKMLYDAVDGSDGYYVSPVDVKYRSLMNVPFTLSGGEDLEKKFLKEADQAGLESLKGHRSVGGARASIYNAMPKEGVQALVDFMAEFKKSN